MPSRPYVLQTAVALLLVLASPVALAQDARISGQDTVRDPPAVSGYAGIEWRGNTWADHVSHGPGISFGAIFLRGHLRVGLTFVSRPGPINPATFDLHLPDGETYREQDELALRSDGAMYGLTVAPIFRIPGSTVHVETPVTFGQAIFGFYLTDDNRDTPDGRRVSEWEDELMDGRDASGGLSLEVGTRALFALNRSPWLRPYVGAHYLTTFGYDAFMSDNYSGFGVSAGFEVGAF